jgi:hypothetical protein
MHDSNSEWAPAAGHSCNRVATATELKVAQLGLGKFQRSFFANKIMQENQEGHVHQPRDLVDESIRFSTYSTLDGYSKQFPRVILEHNDPK